MTNGIPRLSIVVAALLLLGACGDSRGSSGSTAGVAGGYSIVSTNQTAFFDNSHEISRPAEGRPFYGQDAEYPGNSPHYVDNGDGTITDTVTGLMWEQGVMYVDWSEAPTAASGAATGGHHDWRVPTIKELYSLIDFTGNQGTGDPSSSTPPADALPFLATDVFEFEYPSEGRYIDVQFISTTEYTGTALGSDATFFGVNFADGRIKAYPESGNPMSGFGTAYALRLVRGNPDYGKNSFVNNGDGTITDTATGLMWARVDSGGTVFTGEVTRTARGDGSLNWQEALAFAEGATYAGHSDWRLPDAKELHSILDYGRSPDATASPAIDPLFDTTGITNEAGRADYPGFWTSTTFEPGTDAVVIFFGRAMGYVDPDDPIGNSNPQFIDVHGAGCQRTDPKTGEPSFGHGPQGDVRRVYNYVRLVRDA